MADGKYHRAKTFDDIMWPLFMFWIILWHILQPNNRPIYTVYPVHRICHMTLRKCGLSLHKMQMLLLCALGCKLNNRFSISIRMNSYLFLLPIPMGDAPHQSCELVSGCISWEYLSRGSNASSFDSLTVLRFYRFVHRPLPPELLMMSGHSFPLWFQYRPHIIVT